MRLADLLRCFPGSGVLRNAAFRTGAIRWWWRYRHFIDGSYCQAPLAMASVDPHREQLWSLIRPFAPQSLLEVGCGDGANLALLARRAPTLRLDGVDVNPRALAVAKQRVLDAGGTPRIFQRARADRLPVATGSVDVALSDAVFMYLPPAQAVAALREMRRVARRAAIVHTFADDQALTSTIVGGNWVHAFRALVSRAIPGARWVRHPSASVTTGQWRDFGATYVITW